MTSRAPFRLEFRPRRQYTDQEELSLYRSAYARSPESVAIRGRFALLLNALSRFEESAALLKSWNIDDYPFRVLQIHAALGLKTVEGVAEARMLCEALLDGGLDAAELCAVHQLLGDVLLRQAEPAAARHVLLSCLERGGFQHGPFWMLVQSELAQGHAADVLALAQRFLAAGPPAAGIIASQILAHAQLGHVEEALELQALDRFLQQYEPAPPDGWETLAAFNQDLAAELAAHPSARDRVEGASSSSYTTSHVPQPDLKRSHVYHAFQQMIRREVMTYYAALPEAGDHPFLRMCRPAGTLANWVVMTEGDGFEHWHQHPGWLSGTYYAQVPAHIAQGTGLAGCIAFGLPSATASGEVVERFGAIVCRPRSGLLVLFPSYTHHRTYPHAGPGSRICCAFDVDLLH